MYSFTTVWIKCWLSVNFLHLLSSYSFNFSQIVPKPCYFPKWNGPCPIPNELEKTLACRTPDKVIGWNLTTCKNFLIYSFCLVWVPHSWTKVLSQEGLHRGNVKVFFFQKEVKGHGHSSKIYVAIGKVMSWMCIPNMKALSPMVRKLWPMLKSFQADRVTSRKQPLWHFT